MKVWFASSGEYSDYRVNAVFISKELAQKYVDTVNTDKKYDGDSYIEPDDDEGYELIESLPEPIKQIRRYATIYNDHEEGERLIEENVFPGINEVLPPADDRYYVILAFRPNRYPHELDRIQLSVEGSDIERVNKVYSEKLAQIKAEFDIIVEKEKAERAARR